MNNNTLKHRLYCIGLFLIFNVMYFTLVLKGQIQSEGGILYGIVAFLWAMRLRQARNQYHQHSTRIRS